MVNVILLLFFFEAEKGVKKEEMRKNENHIIMKNVLVSTSSRIERQWQLVLPCKIDFPGGLSSLTLPLPWS